MSDESTVYRGSCYCGSVTVTVKGPPVASAYCHCLECRKWHSAPINAWSIWPKDSVTIDGPITTSQISERSHRVSCQECGGCVANVKPTVGMIVVYPMTLTGPGATFKYKPAFHIFYEERVIDVSDGLPKFASMPEQFGGSGKTIEEPASSGWR